MKLSDLRIIATLGVGGFGRYVSAFSSKENTVYIKIIENGVLYIGQYSIIVKES